MNKYSAKATIVDGHRFDSKAEAARYIELSLLQRAGEIEQLSIHPVFFLHTINPDGNRVPVMYAHRPARYIADFRYRRSHDQSWHVEDVKSAPTMTPISKLKMAIVAAQYGISVEVVLQESRGRGGRRPYRKRSAGRGRVPRHATATGRRRPA